MYVLQSWGTSKSKVTPQSLYVDPKIIIIKLVFVGDVQPSLFFRSGNLTEDVVKEE